jgi:hypothetical protein
MSWFWTLLNIVWAEDTPSATTDGSLVSILD